MKSLLLIFLFNVVNLKTSESFKEYKYLALGDSYTIGEGVAEQDRWPNQLAEKWRKDGKVVADPQIIATTGWRTDELIQAIHKAKLKNEYDVVSLLIGVNNQYQGKLADQYAVEFEELINTSIRLAKGNTKNVFVVSIPDYGYTPFGNTRQEVISKEIDQFNLINKKIADQYQIAYISITDISRKALQDTELVASDGLHPSGHMYAQWADRIAQVFFLQ